jgi:hypothetical protein
MVSGQFWKVLFYCSLFLISALSIFGRDLQLVLSKHNLIEVAEYVIGAALIATSLLILTVGRGSSINWQFVFFALVIFVVVPHQIENYTERLHFVCFGVLGVTAYRSFGLTLALILTCSAGLSDEVLQYFLPSRVGEWRDVVMNCLAGISAVMITHKAGE